MTASPQPFSTTWTLGDTTRRLTRPAFPENGTPAEQHAWRQHINDPEERRLSQAIGRHLAWLLAQGHDLEPPHGEHVLTRAVHTFRELAKSPTDPEAQIEAGQIFLKECLFLEMKCKRESPDSAEPYHAGLHQLMAQGDFDYFLADPQICHRSGQSLALRLTGWHPELGTLEYGKDPARPFRSEFVPLKAGQIVPNQTAHLTLPVPSGHLLVADWFHIPAFNALTKPVDDNEPSSALESSAGRLKRTQRYAEQLGVVHVYGRSPSVVAALGAITVGYLDPDGPQPAGYVDTVSADLRWTTIVDRAVLVHLLASTLGAEDAERQLQAYERDTCGLIHLHVAPGTHHLYAAGDEDVFAQTVEQQFETQGLYLDDFQAPLFVLTAQPLAPRVAPAARQRAKL